MEIQKKLIEELQQKYSRSSLVKEFVDLLNISQSAAYNKVNCNSELTLSEYSILSTHYRIHTFEIGSMISSDFPFLLAENRNFMSLTEITISEFDYYLKEYDKPKVRYCTNLIPMQFLIKYPKIFQFTVFVWMENIQSQFNPNYHTYDKINFEKGFKQEFGAFAELTKNFNRCNFHTYLSPNIFQAYFKLLEYHLELDTITLAQVMEIREELEEFTIEFEQLCQNKDTQNYFYIHELNINSIFFQVEQLHTYMILNTPIYMRIENREFNNYINSWLDQIESRSVPISNINEKVRRGLFKNLKNSSEKFFRKIELLHET